MSKITFLDNADQGKNNWWRYLITIILTWGAPNVLGIAVIILLLLYFISNKLNSAYFATLISNPLVSIALVGLTDIVSLLFLYIGVRYIHERKFMSIINTDSKFSWKKILKGGGVWFSLLVLGVIISLLLSPNSLNVTFNPTTFSLLLILSLIVFPIQASFEELFFRGYLMQAFGLLTKKGWKRLGTVSYYAIIPLISTSLIFAILHYANGSNTITSIDIVLQVFIMGLTLGIIALGENRIETAMGVHIANNIFVALIVNTASGGFGNVPSLLTDTAPPNPLLDVPVFILYAVALLIIIFWGKKQNIINIFK